MGPIWAVNAPQSSDWKQSLPHSSLPMYPGTQLPGIEPTSPSILKTNLHNQF